VHHVTVIAGEATEATRAGQTPGWPTLLLASEAADLLRVDRSTVYRWCRLGLIPSVRVGGSVRVHAAHIRDHLAGAA
jgi:excisionase family DNA binding protein